MGENSQIVFIETKSKVPREFYIKKEDLEEHGYTRGCGGCSSVFRGLARQPHNDVCRERLRGILKEGAKVKNAEGRRQDFEKKELEKKRKKEDGEEDSREEKRSRGEEVPDQEGGASSSGGPDVQMNVEVPGDEMSVDDSVDQRTMDEELQHAVLPDVRVELDRQLPGKRSRDAQEPHSGMCLLRCLR